MALLEKTINYLNDPMHMASFSAVAEIDAIAVNIIANLPGFVYWKNEEG